MRFDKKFDFVSVLRKINLKLSNSLEVQIITELTSLLMLLIHQSRFKI